MPISQTLKEIAAQPYYTGALSAAAISSLQSRYNNIVRLAEEVLQEFQILDDPITALLDIAAWWDGLPSKLRQDIEGSGAEPGCITKARRLSLTHVAFVEDRNDAD